MSHQKKNIIQYLLILPFFCISNTINGMQNVLQNVCITWDTKEYKDGCSPTTLAILHSVNTPDRFLHTQVLEGDGYEIIAQQIAKNPCVVYCNDPNTSSQHNSRHQNIIFTKPRNASCDYVTLFDTALINKPILIQSLKDHRPYLKEQGKFLTLIQTQENEFCPEVEAFKTLYSEIYKSASPEYKKNLRKELLPAHVDFKNAFYTEEELRIEIAKIGYAIISYERKKYNIIIKDELSYYNYLTQVVFQQFTECFDLPKEAIVILQQKFANLILATLQRNRDGNLEHPLDMTEVIFSKHSPFEIKIRKKINDDWEEI